MAPSDDRPEADAAPTPPARIREFLADLDDDRADLTFDDETVEVPSRFDRPAATGIPVGPTSSCRYFWMTGSFSSSSKAIECICGR